MKWAFRLCMMHMQGRFDILQLSGNYTFVPGQDNVYGGNNCWNLTISDCRGAVFGGSVVGPMIVATPVYVRRLILLYIDQMLAMCIEHIYYVPDKCFSF